MSYSAAVITLSDRAYRGEREDLNGKVLLSLLKESGFSPVSYTLLPDERSLIEEALMKLSDDGVSLILTTGGTGLSARDLTPDATLAVIDKEVSGIAELIRSESFKITKKAALSRAVCGIRKRSLIINLPGSPKAVRESYGIIEDILDHALEVINSDSALSCGE